MDIFLNKVGKYHGEILIVETDMFVLRLRNRLSTMLYGTIDLDQAVQLCIDVDLVPESLLPADMP